MYAIFTENIELVKLAKQQNEQIIDFSKFKQFENMLTDTKIEKTTYDIENETDITIDNAITDLLFSLVIPPHLKGFNYLRYAIYLLLTDDHYSNVGISKGIYPDTAAHFEVTTFRVERAIRHAIEHSFNNAPAKLLETVFARAIHPNKEKVTNMEFLFCIKFYLQKKYGF